MLIFAALAALTVQTASPGPVTTKVVEDARRALDETLLDFPSARFRDVRGNGFVLCGFVNAKNRMGAYSGWSRFAWLAGSQSPRLLMDGPEGANDVLLDGLCGQDGKRQTGADYSDRLTRR